MVKSVLRRKKKVTLSLEQLNRPCSLFLKLINWYLKKMAVERNS